jgi:hypothetical protein
MVMLESSMRKPTASTFARVSTVEDFTTVRGTVWTTQAWLAIVV